VHVLIGIGLAVVLIGHWFARVLLLTAGVGLIAGIAFGGYGGAWVFGLVVGGIVGWFVSGIPLYYWRYQLTGTLSGKPSKDGFFA
jgi:hypothetical protein